MKVWTFIIRGGNPFRLSLTNKVGPLLDHPGGQGSVTVWKMVGTEEHAASIEVMLRGGVIAAQVRRYTEEEDDEMLRIRREGEA